MNNWSLTGKNGTKKIRIMAPLRYLSGFLKTLEWPSINFEINIDLNWCKNCVIVANNADQGRQLSIIDTKLNVPVVTLSTQNNTKLLEPLGFGFKRTINQNKCQSKK